MTRHQWNRSLLSDRVAMLIDRHIDPQHCRSCGAVVGTLDRVCKHCGAGEPVEIPKNLAIALFAALAGLAVIYF